MDAWGQLTKQMIKQRSAVDSDSSHIDNESGWLGRETARISPEDLRYGFPLNRILESKISCWLVRLSKRWLAVNDRGLYISD